LVVELVKTGNRDDALKNLKFFLDKGLLEDPDGAIGKALADKTALPVLPASHGISELLAGALQRITPSASIGRLNITSTPEGAEILIDGKEVGATHTPQSLEVEAGHHTVVVSLGGKSLSKRVEVDANKIVNVSFDFTAQK
jgi:hypothetical protein